MQQPVHSIVRRRYTALSIALLMTVSASAASSNLRSDFDAKIGSDAPAALREAVPFDWIVPAGAWVSIDTTGDMIQGAFGPVSGTRFITGGLIEVRNVRLGEGARVEFVGPNPVTICASGTVEIAGELNVSGANKVGYTLSGGSSYGLDILVERVGAEGRSGGGAGGDASLQYPQSSSRGGRGQGAFGRPGAGGDGGETSFHPTIRDARRGAGGGGGRFGTDLRYTFNAKEVLCQTRPGMDIEPGFRGGLGGTGAVSQSNRAQGGQPGPSVFQDGSTQNDFYGTGILPGGGVIRGELDQPWAGSGGGAGGDSIMNDAFPNDPISPGFEQHGGGGGAGGGSLTILAQGDILITETGSIHADGGRGGGGENANFYDRVGGGGGGGSGGHLILQSLATIRIDAFAELAGDGYHDPAIGSPFLVHPLRPLSALGGSGGVGRDSQGAGRWDCDAIPLQHLIGDGARVPPVFEPCFQNHAGMPLGSVDGAGGDGGPGVIQLHVRDPETDLIFGGINDDDLTKIFMPRPVGWRHGEFTLQLLPTLQAP